MCSPRRWPDHFARTVRPPCSSPSGRWSLPRPPEPGHRITFARLLVEVQGLLSEQVAVNCRLWRPFRTEELSGRDRGRLRGSRWTGTLMALPPSARGSIRRTRCAGGAFSLWRLLEFDLRNGPGRVDEPDVAEGLGEVAQELSTGGIDLFSEQADVVDEGGGAFEDGAGPSWLSGPGQRLGQPEGAQKKRAFLAFEPVVGPVAVHQ